MTSLQKSRTHFLPPNSTDPDHLGPLGSVLPVEVQRVSFTAGTGTPLFPKPML
jgi:hypothetical protein